MALPACLGRRQPVQDDVSRLALYGGWPLNPSPLIERRTFGPFELDLGTGELTRRGHPIRLEPLPTRLLVELVRAEGRLVLRERLLEVGWKEPVYRSDTALNTAIRQVRRALRDSAHRGGFVETVPRRGYRFAYPISDPSTTPALESDSARQSDTPTTVDARPRAASSAGRAGRSRVILHTVLGLAASLALGLAWTQSRPEAAVRVLILPLETATGSEAAEAIADGVLEDLIAELGNRAPGRLHVIARTSSKHYAGRGMTVGDMAKELSVDYAVEGSLRTEGSRLKLVARLIDAEDERQLWAETMNIGFSSLPATHRVLATRIEESVVGASPDLRAAPGNPARIAADGSGLPDSARINLYMARHLLDAGAPEATERSVAYLERVAASVPGYAPTYAHMAFALDALGRRADARAAAQRAVDLDERSALALYVLGRSALRDDRDVGSSIHYMQHAAAAEPGSPRYLGGLAFALTIAGDEEAARGLMAKAHSLDPSAAAVQADVGFLYYLQRDWAAAELHCERAAVLGAGRWARDCAFDAARLGGDRQRSLDLAAEWLGADQDSGASVSARLAEVLQERLAALEPAGSIDEGRAYSRAVALADAGELDQALQALNASLLDRSVIVMTAGREPRLDPLRGDPRFSAILHELGLAGTTS